MFTEDELDAVDALEKFLHWAGRAPRDCYLCGKGLYEREPKVCWDHWSGDDWMVPAHRACADRNEQRKYKDPTRTWHYRLYG